MTKRQIDRLEAFKGIRLMMEKSHAIWSQDMGIVQAMQDLEEEITFLHEAHASQKRGSKPATQVKDALLLNITNRMLWFCGALRTYAKKVNDLSLIERTDFNRTQLLQLNAEVFSAECRNLLVSIGDLDPDVLPNYGITVPIMESFSSMINLFDVASRNPRMTIVERKTVTAQIRLRLQHARDIVHKQLKNQLSIYMDSHPMFWSDFLSAMIIVDTGPGRKPKSDDQVG